MGCESGSPPEKKENNNKKKTHSTRSVGICGGAKPAPRVVDGRVPFRVYIKIGKERRAPCSPSSDSNAQDAEKNPLSSDNMPFL